MTPPSEIEQLEGCVARVRRSIAGAGRGETFEQLALDLFAAQRRSNPDLAKICGDVEPSDWTEIPAIPATLFRALALTSFPPEQARVVFRTSGTTGDRGACRLPNTALHDLSAQTHARAVLGPLPRRGIRLVPDSVDSSLGHMCRLFIPRSPCFVGDTIDAAGAWAALRRAETPLFVPGTAFAWAAMVAAAGAPVPVPAGTVAMVTGGFKGRVVAVDAGELSAALRRLLPGARLVGEYGMTELGSQLWSDPLGAAFTPPPWMRVRAVDPWTGAPAHEGLLRFTDLANAYTVVSIETGDLGRVDDQGRVTLLGRLGGGAARGCWLPRAPARAPPPPPPPPAATASPLVAVALSSGDPARTQKVLRALAGLRAIDPAPLSQGLSAANATRRLHEAVDAITERGLLDALAASRRRPRRVAVVAAHGVFTSPLEWVALYAAAGCAVHLKAPRRDPAFCAELVRHLHEAGLPVTLGTDRALPEVDVAVAFGTDASVSAVSAPRVVRYGHRFSVSLVRGDPEDAAALARDAAAFDGRGCMAPTAVFVLGPTAPLVDALHDELTALQQRVPRGTVEPSLGPEWRRRVGLARARRSARVGAAHAVVVLPPSTFTPLALPRMVVLHPIRDLAQMAATLAPWRPWLSTLTTDGTSAPCMGWFPQSRSIGEAHQPPFPRRHDGRDMLRALLGSAR